jgi:hypothetical protein
MLSRPQSCDSPVDERMCAADVARGVQRLWLRHDIVAAPEVALGSGRRADLMAVDARGQITIVEIKVSRADLLGDAKWRDYLQHCDRFYWAVPAGFDCAPFDWPDMLPERAGLIVADRYDAAILRDAACHPLSAASRKRETLAFARRAARRLLYTVDPEAAVLPLD